MVEEIENTEQKILTAAEEVFIKKGLDGARMQEIADKAGINKSLLHYYYRTKEKLFETVFKAAFKLFVPRIQKAINENNNLFEIIEFFVHNYIDLLSKNQFIPGFVMSELRRNPDWVIKIFKETIGNDRVNLLKKLQNIINDHVERGIIKPIKPIHFLINMLSLCIFPIIVKPIVTGIFLNENNIEYTNFIEERKIVVTEFIINSIKI